MALRYITRWILVLFAGLVISSVGLAKSALTQNSPSIQYVEQRQPGDVLLAIVKAQGISEKAEMVAVINDTKNSGEIPEQSASDLLKYPAQIIYLLSGLQQQVPMSELLQNKADGSASDVERYIRAALLLYPIESYQLLQKLEQSSQYSKEQLLDVAAHAGLKEGWRYIDNIRSDDAIKIQPLFHSASVTLFKQKANNRAAIRFREMGKTVWHEGLYLQWDPVRAALSGSIVHLQSETGYQIEITHFEQGKPSQKSVHSFRTRNNTPPVDANKVYQLSDIYQGGRLDLKALKIKGSAEGWAKIVGDPDTPIIANENDNSAIRIADNSYILFENITVVGGRKHAINSYKAHHLWFNGCNISGWGRAPNIERDGKYYDKESDQSPINYDSAFALMRTGVVVVENCTVHSPRAKASHWGNGHPMGPNAYLAWANHPNPDFKGQVVLRNNRFYGSPEHRFNDVIEGDSNPRMWGGFVRDSAIYDNYLAYANDDVVELDGGQSNVLFYRNEVEQGYCGISTIPNQLGPSYVFNNYIHHLGDERGRSWAAIKMGGVFAAPAGRTLVFENLIVNKSANGIAGARFEGDYSYWTLAQNNILFNEGSWDNKGYGVIDKSALGYFVNNLIYNKQLDEGKIKGSIDVPYRYTEQLDKHYVQQIIDGDQQYYDLPVGDYSIANFSRLSAEGKTRVGITTQGESE